MFRLDGKVSIVTGAGSGIGAAIASAYARAGSIVHVADRDAPSAHARVAEITAAGGRAHALDLDVTSEAQCAAAAAAVNPSASQPSHHRASPMTPTQIVNAVAKAAANRPEPRRA